MVVSGFAFTVYVLLHQNASIKLATVGKDFISNLLDLYFCLELQRSLMFHGEGWPCINKRIKSSNDESDIP